MILGRGGLRFLGNPGLVPSRAPAAPAPPPSLSRACPGGGGVGAGGALDGLSHPPPCEAVPAPVSHTAPRQEGNAATSGPSPFLRSWLCGVAGDLRLSAGDGRGRRYGDR